MPEGNTFFNSLRPKSAFVVGTVAGILAIGTIGFVVLGAMALKGKLPISFGNKAETQNQNQNLTPATEQPQQQQQQAPAPVVPKAEKVKAELFVMSYCPYGLQMEKAFLPVMQLLKNKADLEIKYVSYAMHGLKEVEENTRQYCIDNEQNDKYAAYMNCFTLKDDSKGCLAAAKVNESKLSSCVDATNKKYGIMESYNNQSTWLSGQFPIYAVHQDLNTKYNVQGSPTLIINGTEAQVARSPEAVKKAICDAFDNAPSECGQTLNTNQAAAGFGAGTGSGGNVECTPS